jgi:hypothetical protein
VVLSGGGQILLEIGEGAFELRAGLPGVVTRVIPERGVEIMFNGALVQGLWGNGRVESGLLHSLLTKPDDVLTASQLDVSLRGFILLAGHVSEAATLQSANDLQIRGMILSSLPPALLPVAMQMRLPIMVTDGFGRRPMNPVAYKLLTTNAKRDVTVNAEHYDRYRGTRPEVFIPLPVTQEPPEPREVETFAPGQQVRMCQAPHAGEIGTLLNLRMGLTLFPSGLHAPAAEIRLENGDQITAPLANLEVVG